MTPPSTTINISTTTLLKIIILGLMLVFLYLIRDILILLFVAVILSSAINPWVDWLKKRKVPRPVGLILIYLVGLALISLVMTLLIPPIITEIKALLIQFPTYFEKIAAHYQTLSQYGRQYDIEQKLGQSLKSMEGLLTKSLGSVFATLGSIFGGFISLVFILVITFYLSVKENTIKGFLQHLLPASYQPYLIQLTAKIQEKIGLWFRGQLILLVAVGILAYLGLFILGVQYALVLALWAGLTEFIPYLGPTLGAIPAIFLAFSQSPLKALLVLILYFVIQQVENNILVPKVMQKAIGLNPIVSILAILTGIKLGGILGGLLAIPVATMVLVVVKDLYVEKTSE